MVLGFIIGYFVPSMTKASVIVLPVVIIMIYPMMVNLALSTLKQANKSLVPLIEAIALNFLIAPLLMYGLSFLVTDTNLRIAMILLAIAPASSMGLGYLGLSDGHILTGAIIVGAEFLLAIGVYPLAEFLITKVFAASSTVVVPAGTLLLNLLYVLIIPMILGIATREYIERKHKEGTFKKVKPYFSTITLSFLYILIFLIFATKARKIAENYQQIAMVLVVAIIFYVILLTFALLLNKYVLDMEYRHNQAVVFTSVGKNVALTIAILVAIFGKDGQYMAIAPAMFSIIQAPFLMLYLKFSDKIKAFFAKEIKAIEKEVEEVVEKIEEKIEKVEEKN